MNRPALALVPTLLLLACACGGAPSTGEEGATPPGSALPPAQVSWPAPSVEQLPGWLGIRAGEAGPQVWTGIRTSASLVVLGDAWADVPLGFEVVATGTSGQSTMRFRGVETAHYGCDDTPLQVAAFDGESPGDLVWLMPPGSGSLSAQAVQTTDTPDLRTWSTPAGTLGLRKTGIYTAELWVHDPSQVVRRMDLAERPMDGWEPEALALSQDFLVPQAVGVWSPEGGPAFALASWSSFESDQFTAVVLGETPVEVRVASLYRCAF